MRRNFCRACSWGRVAACRSEAAPTVTPPLILSAPTPSRVPTKGKQRATSHVLVWAAPEVVELEPTLVPVELGGVPDRAAAQLSDGGREVWLPLDAPSRVAVAAPVGQS